MQQRMETGAEDVSCPECVCPRYKLFPSIHLLIKQVGTAKVLSRDLVVGSSHKFTHNVNKDQFNYFG